MENEDDALDLLLSLQFEEHIPESPRLASSLMNERADGTPSLVDISEESGITLSKVDSAQRISAMLPTVESASSCQPPVKEATLNPSSTLPAAETYSGYCSDESLERPSRNVSMAAFKDVVKDSLGISNASAPATDKAAKLVGRPYPCNQADVDQHSGLRIRDRLVSSATLSSRLCDLKVVRLQAIRLAGMATNFKGAWATIGVLTEKGQPKLSAAGKNFVVWKLASLDGALISIFLFGDAYTQHWKESAGAVFTVFNAKVRLDERSKQSSLSVFNGDQMLKIGTSADYSVCKGSRTGGAPCTMVVNKRLQGEYCQYHLGTAYEKVRTKRAEISGGNLATAFSGPGTKRAQTVKMNARSPSKEVKYARPAKQLNSSELRKVLSTADKVTSNAYSQGMRFLEKRSQQHFDEEQKLINMKKKATTKLAGASKKARIPLTEKPVNKSALDGPQGPRKAARGTNQNFEVMELDIDDLDDDMEHARIFFSSKGECQEYPTKGYTGPSEMYQEAACCK